jgi:hypothetical protein
MMEELFRDFWWLIFPIFGMWMAVRGGQSTERSQQRVLDLIKTYTDQGKEPPPELLAMARQGLDESVEAAGGRGKNDHAWTFITFAALTAGFGLGWYLNQAEDFAWAFLIIAATMAVFAVGSLFIMLFGRK